MKIKEEDINPLSWFRVWKYESLVSKVKKCKRCDKYLLLKMFEFKSKNALEKNDRDPFKDMCMRCATIGNVQRSRKGAARGSARIDGAANNRVRNSWVRMRGVVGNLGLSI